MFVDIGLKFYAFTTHLNDLEVKVMGHRFLINLVAKHKSGELRCPATALINFSAKKPVFCNRVHQEMKFHLIQMK